MRDSIRLSFSGYMNLGQLDLAERESSIVGLFQEQSDSIAREISERIGEALGATPSVSIDFAEGSVEWFGWVEWLGAAWPSIEVMSTVGGAIGLIQLVKTAIDSVLRRWFRREVGRRPSGPFPSSRVIIISAPAVSVKPRIMGTLQQNVFGVAALITSLAALIAALALLLAVIRP